LSDPAATGIDTRVGRTALALYPKPPCARPDSDRATLSEVSDAPDRSPPRVARPRVEVPAPLARAVAGDVQAFLLLYEAHAAEVRAIARRFLPGPFEQEEAIQEIWLQVHRGLASYDAGRGTFGAWLQAVAINCCRQMLRAARRRLPGTPEDEPSEGPAAAEDPEHEVRNRRLQVAVADFTRRLDPLLAEVLKLALIEELSHDEIAGRLGVSVRRSKYLKKLVLARATRDPGLKAALDELAGRDR
jgi:RNA polymerase sigma-70 factor (ECF subfamily)